MCNLPVVACPGIRFTRWNLIKLGAPAPTIVCYPDMDVLETVVDDYNGTHYRGLEFGLDGGGHRYRKRTFNVDIRISL